MEKFVHPSVKNPFWYHFDLFVFIFLSLPPDIEHTKEDNFSRNTKQKAVNRGLYISFERGPRLERTRPSEVFADWHFERIGKFPPSPTPSNPNHNPLWYDLRRTVTTDGVSSNTAQPEVPSSVSLAETSVCPSSCAESLLQQEAPPWPLLPPLRLVYVPTTSCISLSFLKSGSGEGGRGSVVGHPSGRGIPHKGFFVQQGPTHTHTRIAGQNGEKRGSKPDSCGSRRRWDCSVALPTLEGG